MKSGKNHHRINNVFFSFVLIVLFVITNSGCAIDLNPLISIGPNPEPPITTTVQNLPMAMVNFEVAVPGGAPQDNIGLELLDEVTGLALNPQRYSMTEKAPGLFSVEIPFPLGTIVKYRYLRLDKPMAFEYTASGNQVRYRVTIVDGPSTVQDIVSAWTDYRYSGPTGRIKGQVVLEELNIPVPNALVISGGVQTVTSSDGSFLLEGLLPGTHNLVVYSMDGSTEPFQQGALLAENATTAAFIQVKSVTRVKVTFIAQIPETNIKGLPVRLVGNIPAFGNTFADLEGGLSVVGSRAPLMTMVSEGIYSFTADLPVGLDLRYKYTLGDGFWNAEHTSEGLFRVRQLIVPESDFTATDIIDTWRAGNFGPITFTVQVPENTPKEDIVSIQFNPYGWTTPIQMWPLGNNQWVYVLYSPLNMLGTVGYRYCRNDQCGSADDVVTQGNSAQGFPFTPSEVDQSFQDEVRQWAWWSTDHPPTMIIAPQIEPRGRSFVAGLEFSPNYSPTWQPYQIWSFQNALQLGANWVILSPTWHYTRYSPPVFESVPGIDPLWQEVANSIQFAQQNGLQVAIFPQLIEPQPGTLWKEPITDYGWWNNWFERYQVFIRNYADLADQTNASMLVIGGSGVAPALSGGKVLNGESSGVPADADNYWRELIQEVRGRYTGQIAWALPYTQEPNAVPDWISEVDLIYLLLSTKLSDSTTADEGSIQNNFGNLLDQNVYDIYESTTKPVVIAIDYPSVDGAATACVQVNNECLDFDRFSQPFSDVQEVQIDLTEQANIYSAALNAIYQRSWIAGFISRGYYPPAAIQDKSSSIHGKPAADILWYWFPKLLGE